MPTKSNHKWAFPNRGRINDAVAYRIRIALKMGSEMPFPICGRRNMNKAKALAASGETYHLEKNHVCEKCRCNRTAGQATHGWWYWPEDNDLGLPEVGHHGVGPCYWHGQCRWIKTGYKGIGDLNAQVQKEIEIMRQMGHAPDDGGKWLIDIKHAKELADYKLQTRSDISSACDSVRKALEEYQEKIKKGAPLTERGGKAGSMPITDVTAIKLELDLAKGLSELAKTDFLTAQNDYVHRDEMISFAYSSMQLAEKYIKNEDDWKDYVAQFKRIVLNVRGGKPKGGNDD